MSSINKSGSAEVNAIQQIVRKMAQEPANTLSETAGKVTKVIEEKLLNTLPLEKELAETWELFNRATKLQNPEDSITAKVAIEKLKELRQRYRKEHPNTELHYLSSEGRIVLVSYGKK